MRKQSCLSFICGAIYFALLLMILPAHAQCPAPNTPSCTAGSPYFGVVINEVSPDGGNIEAVNDGLVELAGPPGTNIGGMVLSNGEWAVVIPSGTTIPADGVFLIGCQFSTINSAYEPVSGLSCSVCDYEGLVVDFDVCNPANAAYVSASMSNYGFTLDNGFCGNNFDGDQIILFQPNGAVQDAVHWGAPASMPQTNGSFTLYGGSTGLCGSGADHISVQDDTPYTLGDNDGNGIINDYTGSAIGRRADGGNAQAVNIMPTGNGPAFVMGAAVPGGTLNAHLQCYTMPGIRDPRWIYLGTAPTGCNSSYVRLAGTTGSQGTGTSSSNPSHADDPDCSAFSTYNPLIPSSCDAAAAASQWGYTDHPTPGVVNDADIWDLFVSICGGPLMEITNSCNGTLEVLACNTGTIDLSFEYRIYNWRHVSGEGGTVFTGDAGHTTVGNYGSYINIPASAGGAGITPWNFSKDLVTGITTLSRTITGIPIGEHTFALQWKDYIYNCCGSASPTSNNECYERVTPTIKIVQPLPTGPLSIACPPATPGLVNVRTAAGITNDMGCNLQYTLRNNGIDVSTNTTGIFNLPNTLAGPLTVEVISNCPASALVTPCSSLCNAPLTVNIDNACRQTPPPCPVFADDPTCSTPDGPLCPGDNIQLSLSATASANLPNGGVIEWVLDTNNDGNVYDESAAAVVATQSIGVTGGDTPKNCSNLAAGDIAIIRIHSDATKSFSFILLQPIAANTSISFTDVGVNGTNWYSSTGEGGFITWTSPAGGAPAGTIITVDHNGSPLTSGSTSNLTLMGMGSISYYEPSGTSDFNLATAGDQVLAFCGTIPSSGFPIYANLNFLAAATTYAQNLWQYNSAEGSNSSDIPMGLTNGVNAVAVGAGTNGMEWDNSQWNCDGSPITSTSSALLNNISNFVNWTGSDAAQTPPACSVTINNSVTILSPACASYTVPASACNTTIRIRPRISPTYAAGDCTGNNMPTLVAKTYTVTCPTAAITTAPLVVCGATASFSIDFDNYTPTPTMVTVNYTRDGMPVSTGPVVFADPLVVNVSQSGLYELTGVSFTPGSPSNCMATVSGAVEITLTPNPTATITGTTDITGCDPGTADDGSVNISFGPAGTTGPWVLDYAINGVSYSVTTSSNPYTLVTDVPGNYEIVRVTHEESGCFNDITGQSGMVGPAPAAPTASNLSRDICEGDDFNLGSITETDISANPAGGTISWFNTDPTLLPPAQRALLVLTGGALTVSADQSYYFVYTLPNACEVVGALQLNVIGCCPLMTASIGGGGTICNGKPVPANIVITITGGTGPYTVTYSDGVSNFVVNNYVSVTNIPVSPAQSTAYTLVSVADEAPANTGCPVTIAAGAAQVTVLNVGCGSFPWNGN